VSDLPPDCWRPMTQGRCRGLQPTRATGRIRKFAAARVRPDRDERYVAIGIVSSATAGRAKHSSAASPTRACWWARASYALKSNARTLVAAIQREGGCG